MRHILNKIYFLNSSHHSEGEKFVIDKSMFKELSGFRYAISAHLPIIIFWMFALLCGAIEYFWSPAGDDVSYAVGEGGYGGYAFRGEEFPGFGVWWDFFLHHAKEINGRLGDKFITLYLAVPHWLQSIITALSVWTILLMTSRLAYGKNYRSSNMLMAGACIILLMPWYDSFFLSCMVLNYGIATALALVWIWKFLNPFPLTWFRCIGIGLLSFIVGAWHEAFSILFLPSLVLLLACRKDLRQRSNILMTVGFLSGVAFILLCPGFWVRMGREYDVATHPYSYYMLAGMPVYIIVAVLVIRAVRKYLRKEGPADKTDSKVWVWYVAVAMYGLSTCFVIVKTSETYFRAWWTADLLALSVLAHMYAYMPLKRAFRNAANWGLTVLATVNLVISLYWQIKIHREYEQVMDIFMSSPHRNVYYDTSAPESASFLTLRKVQRDVYMHHSLRHIGDLMLGETHRLTVLPKELEGLDTLHLRRVKMNRHLLMTPANNILLEDTTIELAHYAAMIYMNKQERVGHIPVILTPFRSEGGKPYVYVKPLFHTWETPFVIDKPCQVM